MTDRELMRLALEALDRADKISGHANNLAVRKALREALAEQPMSEIIGWTEEQPCNGCVSYNCDLYGKPDNAPCLPTPIYAPQPAQEQPGQQGWQSVPMEPTIEMIAALGFGGDIDMVIGHAAISKEIENAYTAMLAVAPQPAQQEPVGYIASMAMNDLRSGIFEDICVYAQELEETVAIYADPPAQRQPLTDEEYTKLAHRIASKYSHRTDPTFVAYTFLPHTLEQFVRAIEAAHGITEENT